MKMQLLVLGCLVALATGIEVRKSLRQGSDPSSSSGTTDAGAEAPSEQVIGHQCHRGECWNCDYMCDENNHVCANKEENCERRFCCQGSNDKCFQDDQCPKGATPDLYPGHRCHEQQCWHCDYMCTRDDKLCDKNDENCYGRFCCVGSSKNCTTNCHCPAGISPVEIAGSRCHQERCWNCHHECSNEDFPCDDNGENCKGSFVCEQSSKTCTDDNQCLGTAVEYDYEEYEDDDDEDEDRK